MKKLYVSDLDGTLLNSGKKVTEFTADVINKFIAQGGLFTIATARMAYGCDYKLSDIKLNIPGIIMNGACLYSFAEKKYMDVKSIEDAKVAEIDRALQEQDCNAFMYTYLDNALSIYFKTETDGENEQYLSKRAWETCREVKQAGSFTQTAKDKQVIYFALTGQKEKIQCAFDSIKEIGGIASAMYLNIYNGLYCLEIFDQKANKANALAGLKDRLQVDEITAFGDNHNDIEMLKYADLCYVPENAVEEAKKIANGILESCDNDGVARFIQQKYNL